MTLRDPYVNLLRNTAACFAAALGGAETITSVPFDATAGQPDVSTGNPGASEAVWRTAGVDRFIFIKCDVLETLREMLREEGVLTA